MYYLALGKSYYIIDNNEDSFWGHLLYRPELSCFIYVHEDGYLLHQAGQTMLNSIKTLENPEESMRIPDLAYNGDAFALVMPKRYGDATLPPEIRKEDLERRNEWWGVFGLNGFTTVKNLEYLMGTLVETSPFKYPIAFWGGNLGDGLLRSVKQSYVRRFYTRYDGRSETLQIPDNIDEYYIDPLFEAREERLKANKNDVNKFKSACADVTWIW